MGDKSPKSKTKHKNQDAANKNQKKSDAYAKQHPTPAMPARKGK